MLVLWLVARRHLCQALGMVVLFTAFLACSTGPSHEAETVGQVVKVSETTAGTIGGEPILPSPISPTFILI